jgi:hypothetical protein
VELNVQMLFEACQIRINPDPDPVIDKAVFGSEKSLFGSTPLGTFAFFRLETPSRPNPSIT